MKYWVISLIVVIMFPSISLSQVQTGETYWNSAYYIGMLYDGIHPCGDGKLIYKWSEQQKEIISGTFTNDTVFNARVDLIPEGCSFSGTLKYDIDNDILTLKFIKGMLTINSISYMVENQLYISNCFSKKYKLGTELKSINDGTYWLNVEDVNTNEFIIDFKEFSEINFPIINGTNTLQMNIGKPLKLQLKLGENRIDIIRENKLSSSLVKSKDNDIILDGENKTGIKTLTYKVLESSKLLFHGTYESSNKFNVTNLTSIDIVLKDALKIQGNVRDLSDGTFLGTIKHDNGDVINGIFKLNLNRYNSVVDFIRQATIADVIIIEGKVTKPNGKVFVYQSPEEIEFAKRLAKQKEDSIWNSIPIQTYSGLYQPDTKATSGLVRTTEDRTKTLIGNITYSYRVRDGKRAFEGLVKYHNDFITITGNYEHGIKTGKWTFKYNADKDTRRVRGIDLYDIEIEYKDGKKNGRYTLVEKGQNGSIISQMSLIMKNDEVVEVVNATFPRIDYSSNGRNGRSSIIIGNPKISGSVNGSSYMLNIIPTGVQKEIYGIFYESEYALVYKNKSTGETQSMPSNEDYGAYGAITKEIRFILLNIEIILP